MTIGSNTRTIGGATYGLMFNADNRLATVMQSASANGQFWYDAEGNRVLSVVSGTTTVYLAGLYEYAGGATTKYYDGGAMRRAGYAADNGVFYLLTDQAKSTTGVASQTGALQAQNFYLPYGDNRSAGALSTLTTKQFKGATHETNAAGGSGLNQSSTSWYDPQIGGNLARGDSFADLGQRLSSTSNSYAKTVAPANPAWLSPSMAAGGAVCAPYTGLPRIILRTGIADWVVVVGNWIFCQRQVYQIGGGGLLWRNYHLWAHSTPAHLICFNTDACAHITEGYEYRGDEAYAYQGFTEGWYVYRRGQRMQEVPGKYGPGRKRRSYCPAPASTSPVAAATPCGW